MWRPARLVTADGSARGSQPPMNNGPASQPCPGSGNAGDAAGFGQTPRWSAERRRPGCAGRLRLASVASRLTGATMFKVVRLPALRRPLGSGVGADDDQGFGRKPAQWSAKAAEMRWRQSERDSPDAEHAPRERERLRGASRGAGCLTL